MSLRFLTLQEVADEVRAPLSSVRTWIASGRLRHARPGKRVIVRRDWLDEFLAAATRGGE